MEEKNLEESGASLAEEMESVYTTLEEAKVEIWRRWNDKELRKKVDDFLKNDFPDVFRQTPMAVLARQVASPNFEATHFLNLAREINLDALFLEYLDDTFVAGNIDKYYLCKLFFHGGNNKNENNVIGTCKVIDFNNAEGKKLDILDTIWGEKLIDFHHKLLDSSKGSRSMKLFDISDFYKRNGATADKYYAYFFALFICHGVLVENYLLGDLMSDFVREIVLPNFKKVSEIFGLKPIIVHLGPTGEEENLYWRYYPLATRDMVEKNK